jgi:hypothetical protein
MSLAKTNEGIVLTLDVNAIREGFEVQDKLRERSVESISQRDQSSESFSRPVRSQRSAVSSYREPDKGRLLDIVA